jgi:hypothetical protein
MMLIPQKLAAVLTTGPPLWCTATIWQIQPACGREKRAFGQKNTGILHLHPAIHIEVMTPYP